MPLLAGGVEEFALNPPSDFLRVIFASTPQLQGSLPPRTAFAPLRQQRITPKDQARQPGLSALILVLKNGHYSRPPDAGEAQDTMVEGRVPIQQSAFNFLPLKQARKPVHVESRCPHRYYHRALEIAS
jgi:hypothetical protein